MTRFTVVGVIHKLTVGEFVDCTNTPNTDDLLWRNFLSPKCKEITHVTLTTPTQRTVSHHKANTSNGQPVYKI